MPILPTALRPRLRLLPDAAVLPAFAATLFVSAALLFLVEPMVAKLVLPRLGGSPAVWSTCLLFFQAMLLLGYGYAHALVRLLPRWAQVAAHLGVVLPLAALALPLGLGAEPPAPDGSPVLWLLGQLVVRVGPPAFAIAATAPLLQAWFAGLDHPAAGNPYVLYAGSNAGSLLALLAYPLLVEPALPLDRQALLWSVACAGLALGVALAAAATLQAAPPRPAAARLAAAARPAAPLRPRARLRWTALACVPSSLLLGVTTHITKDIAAAPLLWVLPLALYLLTFILTFMRRPPLPHAAMARLLPPVIVLMVALAAPGAASILPVPALLGLHLVGFFVLAMVCHGELARLRPDAAHLTEFYLFLSIGGVLGGVCNALLAPVAFPDVWEYPLALVAGLLLRPPTASDAAPRRLADILLPLALLALLLVLRAALGLIGAAGAALAVALAVACLLLPALALLALAERRLRFALGVAACLAFPVTDRPGEVLTTQRSFFGIYRVLALDADGLQHVMMNGTTLHGAESLRPGEAATPMAYYTREGPFGRFFAALGEAAVRRVAVIGLGSGALACHARPGQDWTFYEIDPLVERIARDGRYFRFLDACGAGAPRVVLGDARLTLAGAADGAYDVLVLDAFSSDSIPMHLITREALALYLRKLAPGGHLLFHISSRSLDLRPVLGALAADAGWPARLLWDPLPALPEGRRQPAVVVAMAGPGADLAGFADADGWQDLPAGGPRFLWTDQRSDLLGVIRFGR